MSLDLNQLRCFVAVAEELHFGRAAQRLNISQPPVTQRIKRLEDALGVQLLIRSKRNVLLTGAGSALLEQARELLKQADVIRSAVHAAQKGQTGTLRAGFFATAVFSAAHQNLLRIVEDLPGVHVRLEEMNSIDQIKALQLGQIDIGLAHTPIEHHGLHAQLLTREPALLAVHASHAYATQKSVTLQQVKADRFIFPTRFTAPGQYDGIIAACNTAGFSPLVKHQARHMLTIVGMVSINAGIAFVPKWLRTCVFPDVVFLEIQGSQPVIEISILWNPANESPVLARVLRMLGYETDGS